MEETIKKTIEAIKRGEMPSNVKSYNNYGTKYAILKSEATMKIALKEEGVVFEIDFTEELKESLK